MVMGGLPMAAAGIMLKEHDVSCVAIDLVPYVANAGMPCMFRKPRGALCAVPFRPYGGQGLMRTRETVVRAKGSSYVRFA